MNEKQIIKLKIKWYVDKDNLISALANNGIKVWVEEVENIENSYVKDYFVCFEYDENKN